MSTKHEPFGFNGKLQDDSFSENYLTTIGVDFRFKTLRADDKRVKLQIVFLFSSGKKSESGDFSCFNNQYNVHLASLSSNAMALWEDICTVCTRH